MPELFERYCESLLRKQYPDTLAGWGNTGKSETRAGTLKLRPDFVIPSMNTIVDSKYKYWIAGQEDKEGMQQMALYGREKKTLQQLNHDSELPILQFLYPSESGNKDIDLQNSSNSCINDYLSIKKYPLKIDDL
jgi:hypothetical protein